MADLRVLVFDPTEFFPDQITSSDRVSFPGGFVNAGAAGDMGAQKLTNVGDATADGDALVHSQSGAVLSGLALSSQKLTGLADGTAASDAVNKGQLDTLAHGFNRKAPCVVRTTADLSGYTEAGSGATKTLEAPTDATADNTQNGVLLEVGDRVLVMTAGDAAGSADTANGIYEVTTLGDGAGTKFKMTRAEDANADAEVTAGMYTFCTEGTSYADTGWFITTNDPITVDTTAIAFDQFAGVGTYTAGDGLDLSAGGEFSVDLDADGGLEIVSTELAVKLDGSTLQRAAAGLSVLGLPSLFTVNGTAVGATVTAPNLDDLTDGSTADSLHTHANLHAESHTIASHNDTTATGAELETLTDGSNADALHTHAAATATEAPKVENTLTTSAAVAAGDPVRVSGADTIAKADAAAPSSNARVIGVARTADAVGGNDIEVVSIGECAGVLSSATPNTPYYLASGGGLTTTVPTGAMRIIRVGFAISADDLWVDIADFGRRAA